MMSSNCATSGNLGEAAHIDENSIVTLSASTWCACNVRQGLDEFLPPRIQQESTNHTCTILPALQLSRHAIILVSALASHNDSPCHLQLSPTPEPSLNHSA